MKKAVVLLLTGSVMTLTACDPKPKTVETSVDSTAAILDSIGTGIDSAATATVDSAAAATAADSTR